MSTVFAIAAVWLAIAILVGLAVGAAVRRNTARTCRTHLAHDAALDKLRHALRKENRP